MRPVLFVLFLLFTLPVMSAEVSRPLPKLIQSLSADDYETWARWQNRQAELRAEREARYSFEQPYVYARKSIVNRMGGKNSSTRIGSVTHNVTSATIASRPGLNHRNSSSVTSRSGYADRISRSWDTAIATSYQHRYTNTAYVPPSPISTYNPFVKPAITNGEPDWDNLFVPCENGTQTLTEALDSCNGPVSPEKLYAMLLEEWF